MFQISKPMRDHKVKTAEEYFSGWISWFKGRGIKTEIRKDGKGPALWREGIEAKKKK